MAIFNLITFFHALVLTVLLVATSKERLELEQRIKAQTDPLTGAFNRRAFMARGERLLLRHKFEQAPLCLLFLDIDHFKSTNDRLGHSGGDDVLIKCVAVVQNNMRPTDFLFRIGGEEFCCLLPYTSGERQASIHCVPLKFACRLPDRLRPTVNDAADDRMRVAHCRRNRRAHHHLRHQEL